MKFYQIKKIKSSLMLACIGVIAISSCKKDFGDINKSWDNRVYAPTIPALFNNISASMQDAGGTGILYTSFIYQSTQLAAMYASSGYRMDNQVEGAWGNYYTALANSYKLYDMIDADPNADKMTNVRAMTKTLLAYKALHTTMLFGDMPYSQAGKVFYGPEYYRPVYDKQADIFASALEDLNWAIANFTPNENQVSLGASETIFNGDVTKWVKFANSLRLRYAMVMHVKDPAKADAIIADALNKPLLVAGEHYGFYPGSLPDVFYDRIGMYNGNSYIRMSSTMFDAMSSSDSKDGSGIFDLRCNILFEPNRDGEWVPFPINPPNNVVPEVLSNNDGTNPNPYDGSRLTTWQTSGKYLYAPLNFYYVADRTIPHLFITCSEVSFLKAEIYNRGIGGVAANPALAKQHYEEGITESVKFWYKVANESTVWAVNQPDEAPTPLEMANMLAHPEVAYSSNAADALLQIYKQSWIAFFHQPYEAWNLKRRTNHATPSETLSPSSPVLNMNKLVYPPSETETNYDNWKAITGGSNDMTVKPWFMP